jgi:hypothetical protein
LVLCQPENDCCRAQEFGSKYLKDVERVPGIIVFEKIMYRVHGDILWSHC